MTDDHKSINSLQGCMYENRRKTSAYLRADAGSDPCHNIGRAPFFKLGQTEFQWMRVEAEVLLDAKLFRQSNLVAKSVTAKEHDWVSQELGFGVPSRQMAY